LDRGETSLKREEVNWRGLKSARRWGFESYGLLDVGSLGREKKVGHRGGETVLVERGGMDGNGFGGFWF